MRRTVVLATVAASLSIPAAAQAHVTLQPNSAPAGAFTRLDVRIPNERDDASTVKIELQLPDGFASASYEPVPGWDVAVKKEKLATPIETDDGTITEGVSQITWTAADGNDGIPPGAFEDFGLSVQIPGEAGDELTFKALQTYSDGEVVRWIGAEGSENPAPIVTVTESAGEDHHGASDEEKESSKEATPTPVARAAATTTGGDDSGNGLSIVALIVGALGLVVGGYAVLVARRA